MDFKLHDKQLEVFNSEARFKVVAAGRRAGKSYLSAVTLLIEGMKEKNEYGVDIRNKEVWYVAPTFNQAKDIMWNLLKTLGEDVIESTLENTAQIKLVNGRKIQLKGSDRPDTLRGVGISYVVLDEYAFMKPDVWDLIIRPTLADVRGKALFIGTPEGKNHFYDLWVEAGQEDYPDWDQFHFNSLDNPLIAKEEIERAKATMSIQAFRQEFEASFATVGGGAFKEDEILYANDSAMEGTIYIAVDPAGYSDERQMTKSAAKRLDQTAIAVVRVGVEGWFVEEINAFRSDPRETSIKILRMAQKYQAAAVGIEKGSLKNAIMPYLEDNMRRIGVYPSIVELTHGGKKKTERIIWSLQGRFQHGRITLKKAPWNREFVNQLLDFPNPLAHDDMIDALSYIDQISTTVYDSSFLPEEWAPLDLDAGF